MSAELEQFKKGDVLTAESLNVLVDHILALQETVADLREQLGTAAKRPRRRPLERIYRHVGLCKVTSVGTGGNAGLYLWHEQYGGAGAMHNFTDGRRATSFSDASVAREVNGRQDIPVGTICSLYAFEQPDKFEYFIGPFFSSGGGDGGAFTVEIYKSECDEGSPSESLLSEASVLGMEFHSDGGVGGVVWNNADPVAIRGNVWTLNTIAPNVFPAYVDDTAEEITATTVSLTTAMNFNNVGGIQGVQFKITSDDELREGGIAGEECNGKKPTIQARLPVFCFPVDVSQSGGSAGGSGSTCDFTYDVKIAGENDNIAEAASVLFPRIPGVAYTAGTKGIASVKADGGIELLMVDESVDSEDCT